jgi:ankyrin repeat protein
LTGRDWQSFIAAMKPSALLSAAQGGNRDALARLLGAGADVNEKGNGGETALMLAAAHGRLDVIGMLIERGADVNAPTDVGNTALMFAAARGQLDAMRALIERGALVGHKNKYGLGAADWAKWSEREGEILDLLGAPAPA